MVIIPKKKRLLTSKLAKAMVSDYGKPKEKFLPQIDDVKEWFEVINKDIFENYLPPFEKVDIRRLHGYWGACVGCEDKEGNLTTNLLINRWVPSKKFFIGVMAHEMVHSYQWYDEEGEYNHGQSFYAWRPKLMEYGVWLEKNL